MIQISKLIHHIRSLSQSHTLFKCLPELIDTRNMIGIDGLQSQTLNNFVMKMYKQKSSKSRKPSHFKS